MILNLLTLRVELIACGGKQLSLSDGDSGAVSKLSTTDFNGLLNFAINIEMWFFARLVIGSVLNIDLRFEFSIWFIREIV